MMSLKTPVNLLICQKSKVQDWMDHFIKYYKSGSVEWFDDVVDLTDKNHLKCFPASLGKTSFHHNTGVLPLSIMNLLFADLNYQN